MRVFIELPTWLGDCVMATAAIESLLCEYGCAKVVFFGSFASTSLFLEHPNLEKIIIDKSKKSKFRIFALRKIAKSLGKFDISLSFRSSFSSKILLFFIHSDKKLYFKKQKTKKHQVLKYLNLISHLTSKKKLDLKIHIKPKAKIKKTIGLNPGATYGSAKRWNPEYFAKVAQSFANEYEIIIFGSNAEKNIADDIEKLLSQNNIKCHNLAGKTSIKELCEQISALSIFITNDSGPMHIAAAYKVPTIALFGPTKFDETSPWMNENAVLLHLNLECMPCMKRVCPLKTHECMQELKPELVIKTIKKHFGMNLQAPMMD